MLALPLFTLAQQHIGSNCIKVELPVVVMQHLDQQINLHLVSDSAFGRFEKNTLTVLLNGQPHEVVFERNKATLNYNFPCKEAVRIQVGAFNWQKDVDPIPLWMSVLPPLVAIILALLLREVFFALFTGILTGTFIMAFYQGNGFFSGLGKGFLSVVDTYVMASLLDRGHMSIIVFSMVIGGMVHLISKNGGMQGVVNRLSGLARNARMGQFTTWLLGVVIFFDDYANTLVVGNTMRPVADRLGISRAKLAYLVDSTAAPIAAIAFVTTWIGAELSYIQAGIDAIGLQISAYSVFFNSLAYSFYPFLTLAFLLMIMFQNREYGPMLAAERAARMSVTPEGEAVLESEAYEKPRALNAVFPVAVIIFGTLGGLLYTGWSAEEWARTDYTFFEKLSDIIGRGDSYTALLWSSITSLFTALFLTLVQRIMDLKTAVEHIVDGFRTMLTAILILTLAWSVALVAEHLHTADFIAHTLMRISFSPFLIPAFTFIMAALVAFSTGTSWGTMAILYPLILPASWMLTEAHPEIDHAHGLTIFYSVVSAVLAGSILGDHVSPISDTTILSSISSGCNHIEHVRTQMPYALTVGAVSLMVGTIPAAYGFVSPWWLLLLAAVVLYFIIRLLGRRLPQPKSFR
jgi:Na+/H+ antiporter NhaC